MIKEKTKKGQLKIQEMSFMIIAVFLFFALVGLFVVSLMYSNLHESANQRAEERTRTGLSIIAETPEFSCGKPNCIDADKLLVMMNRKNYSDFYFYSSLEVIKTGNQSQLIDCNRANYPDCDRFLVFDKNKASIKKVSNYVALCRKELENEYTYDKCEIAKVIAGIEVK